MSLDLSLITDSAKQFGKLTALCRGKMALAASCCSTPVTQCLLVQDVMHL